MPLVDVGDVERPCGWQKIALDSGLRDDRLSGLGRLIDLGGAEQNKKKYLT